MNIDIANINIHSIIRHTNSCINYAIENEKDFSKLEEFHDKLVLSELGEMELICLLRSSFRVKRHYPNWFVLRDYIVIILGARGVNIHLRLRGLLGKPEQL